MLDYLLYALVVLIVIWLAVRVFLRGPNLAEFDQPRATTIGGRTEPSPENEEVLRRLDAMTAELKQSPMREQITVLRQVMDRGFLGAPVTPEALDVRTKPVDADGVAAEWVLASGADADRRLLYIHGGAFYVGSPQSARMITAGLSRTAGVAVLAIDYRLMPENRRMDSVSDCQTAYRWMLENGPDGEGAAGKAYVAGDSAGGNLALMLSAWARDAGVRPMDGVIAFSPSTDSTLVNPSFRRNIATDPLLGPPLGPIARIPVTLKALIGLILGRVNPSNPIVSPLLGELDNLPPTLVQASNCEMLFDDAHRYVNKARSQGTAAELLVWPGMVHVFQMLPHILPEAREAMDEAARFIAATSA